MFKIYNKSYSEYISPVLAIILNPNSYSENVTYKAEAKCKSEAHNKSKDWIRGDRLNPL